MELLCLRLGGVLYKSFSVKVKTTGRASDLSRPYKGLTPASALRVLKT